MDDSWDFNGAQTKTYTHGIHPYPAMFIPQVANRLLKSYSREGNIICDIFCGSGTALVESRLLKRNAYGIDLNPFAIFLAKAKTLEIDPKLLQREYFKLVEQTEKNFNGAIKPPSFFNVDFWFKPAVINKLSKLKRLISRIKNEKIRNFFLVSFAETVRFSSNTKNSEFKLVRIPKEQLVGHNPDVLGFFKKKTERNIQSMNEYYQAVDQKTWAKVIRGNSAENNGLENESIDCMITSPPYGDSRTTVAYGQFSRLASQWLSLIDDQDQQVDNILLGGKKAAHLLNLLPSKHLSVCIRRITEKDGGRAREVISFYIDLEKCLKNAYRILKRGKYFCLLVGNRTVKQVQLPTDFIIAELGERMGFSLVDLFVRNIPNKRMPSKNSPTNEVGKLEETMCKESIVVLKKN
jgi:DNA modification methylase